jgi:hypothetical protein
MTTSPSALIVLCADELEAEGLGPLACLDRYITTGRMRA